MLASSGILSSLVWMKSTVGQTMASVSSTETLCIVSRSLICFARFGVMPELVGKFLDDLTYLESSSLRPKLASDVTLMSGLAVNLGNVFQPSVGSLQFVFILKIPMASGVAV